MFQEFIKRKARYNRLNLNLNRKKRISALDAATWWLPSTKNRIISEKSHDLSFMIDHYSLDKKELPEFFKWADPVITRPNFIYSLSNVILTSKESQIYLVDIDRSTLDLGSKFDCDNSIFDFFQKESLLKSEILTGNILHLGISSPSNNFWHWMHEIYARLIRVKRFYDINFFDYIIIPKITHKFQREALEILSLDKTKLISTENFYRCIDNVFTLNINNITSANELRKFFQEKYPKDILDKEKLFLDRDSKSGNQKRELLNFNKYKDKYLKSGFRFIRPETLSLSEQVQLFLASKCLVGASGSAFTLAGLMPKGSKVIEIFSKSFVDPAIAMNCAAAQIKYGFYVEDSFRPNKNENWPRDANEKIDADLIKHDNIIKFSSN